MAPTHKYSFKVFLNSRPAKCCWPMPRPTYSAVTRNNEATVMVTGQKEMIKLKTSRLQLITRLPHITGGVNLSSRLTLQKVCRAKGQALTPTKSAFHQGLSRKEKIVSHRKKATNKVSKKPTAWAARRS